MQTHKAMRANAQHYNESVDFMEMFDADTFDEEVDTDVCWMGFWRNEETGLLELAAEFVYDDNADSGWGWYK